MEVDPKPVEGTVNGGSADVGAMDIVKDQAVKDQAAAAAAAGGEKGSSKKKKKSNAEPPATKKEGDEATVPPITITSDEVNFLVYRYLQESGFVHSSFTFAYESLLTKSSTVNAPLPPGALITFLQKGLQYLAIEEHLTSDGGERL
eukprot:CAMPEP_0182504702 /NCGR_PEP_ID=MMETSP1321-20130603/17714_1 /TAXON_ID=91990 /ORGANISM="Bolidomonas sp., Strain RCC1657" /LENGTH=145 /DNA_ID=CAMNT_0024710103 /DNA_START=151 /DNA_END=584 /DNA_ORIENTATION=-